MRYLWRRFPASLLGMPSGEALAAGSQPASRNPVYRWTLLAATLAGLVAHIAVLSIPQLHTSESPWSNRIQLALGMLAFFAVLEAGCRSANFARRTWFLAALA